MKTTHRLYRTLLALPLIAAALCACSNTVNTVTPGDYGATRQPMHDRRIITDPNLNAIVDVVAVYPSVVSGDLKKVTVELFNHRSGTRNFNYKFEWFDAAGNLLTTASSGFISGHIEGNETVSISSVAPSPQAVDFRLKLLNDSNQ